MNLHKHIILINLDLFLHWNCILTKITWKLLWKQLNFCIFMNKDSHAPPLHLTSLAQWGNLTPALWCENTSELILTSHLLQINLVSVCHLSPTEDKLLSRHVCMYESISAQTLAGLLGKVRKSIEVAKSHNAKTVTRVCPVIHKTGSQSLTPTHPNCLYRLEQLHLCHLGDYKKTLDSSHVLMTQSTCFQEQPCRVIDPLRCSL